ncbi:MAG: hypothetical protein J2P17_12995 [Mycobacterium sp.]|nr:hypothetical protein [Mycobacterium sp.]
MADQPPASNYWRDAVLGAAVLFIVQVFVFAAGTAWFNQPPKLTPVAHFMAAIAGSLVVVICWSRDRGFNSGFTRAALVTAGMWWLAAVLMSVWAVIAA